MKKIKREGSKRIMVTDIKQAAVLLANGIKPVEIVRGFIFPAMQTNLLVIIDYDSEYIAAEKKLITYLIEKTDDWFSSDLLEKSERLAECCLEINTEK